MTLTLLLGAPGGAPFYIDADQYERWNRPQSLLDAAPGSAEGFSLDGLVGADAHVVSRLRVRGGAERRRRRSPAISTSRRSPATPRIAHCVKKGAAIDVEQLRVVRGGTLALDGISLQVSAGRVTGLLGPSGSGKSTLIRAVVGVQRITSGGVTVFGEAAGSASLRARIGYVTQAPSVYGDLSVRENLRYFGRIVGATRQRVDEVIDIVDLTSFAERVVARLSGGQRARVSLATALLKDPELLVLDEPTVGLDPVLRRDIWDMFHELAGRGRTLLVSSHVMDEAGRCHDLLLLRDGQLLAAGTPQELRERTRTDDLESVFLRLIEDAL